MRSLRRLWRADFSDRDLGHQAKVLYAAGTYIVCSVLYTGINTPVTSILSALTPDPHERCDADLLPHVRLKAGCV